MTEQRIIKRIKRITKRIHDYEARTEELSVHGHWSLGYYQGQLSILEDVLDDLKDNTDKQQISDDQHLHLARIAKILCSAYGEPGCEKDCTYSDCFAEITAENLYEAGCRIGVVLASDIISNIEQILSCGAEDELRIAVRLTELRKKYCLEV